MHEEQDDCRGSSGLHLHSATQPLDAASPTLLAARKDLKFKTKYVDQFSQEASELYIL